MPLADVIMTAARNAGGEPFTLCWLMAQNGVRDAIRSEHRALDILRGLDEAGDVRLIATHPKRRWVLVSGDQG